MTETIVPHSEWTARARDHARRLDAYVEPFLDRRSRGQKHPVHDFLFTYYPFSPAKLRQWTPALGETIEHTAADAESYPWLERLPWSRTESCATLDAGKMDEATRRSAQFISRLSSRILERAPRFSCFGLHEWAMVYRQPAEQVRHQGYELRMSEQDLAAFVESQTIVCTHYDAFRFFTPEARPMNQFQPTLEQRVDLEQSGCLHANMDLYKWCGKLWPWAGGELLADTFLLAVEGRNLDMRASPYALEHLGYTPIRIETADGREEYRRLQQELQEKSVPVRQRLMDVAHKILESC